MEVDSTNHEIDISKLQRENVNLKDVKNKQALMIQELIKENNELEQKIKKYEKSDQKSKKVVALINNISKNPSTHTIEVGTQTDDISNSLNTSVGGIPNTSVPPVLPTDVPQTIRSPPACASCSTTDPLRNTNQNRDEFMVVNELNKTANPISALQSMLNGNVSSDSLNQQTAPSNQTSNTVSKRIETKQSPKSVDDNSIQPGKQRLPTTNTFSLSAGANPVMVQSQQLQQRFQMLPQQQSMQMQVHNPQQFGMQHLSNQRNAPPSHQTPQNVQISNQLPRQTVHHGFVQQQQQFNTNNQRLPNILLRNNHQHQQQMMNIQQQPQQMMQYQQSQMTQQMVMMQNHINQLSIQSGLTVELILKIQKCMSTYKHLAINDEDLLIKKDTGPYEVVDYDLIVKDINEYLKKYNLNKLNEYPLSKTSQKTEKFKKADLLSRRILSWELSNGYFGKDLPFGIPMFVKNLTVWYYIFLRCDLFGDDLNKSILDFEQRHLEFLLKVLICAKTFMPKE